MNSQHGDMPRAGPLRPNHSKRVIVSLSKSSLSDRDALTAQLFVYCATGTEGTALKAS